MKKVAKFLFILAMITTLSFPSFVFAQSGLIPCGTERSLIKTDPKGNSTGGEIINPCNISHVYKLVNNVVDFILKDLAIPIGAIAIFYAGILLLFSGGSSEQKGKAKKIFTGVALGLVFIAGAWLIVKTVLTIVGYKDIGAIF